MTDLFSFRRLCSTVQFTLLPLRTSMPTEPFLSVIDKPVVLRGMIKSFIHNGEEEEKLGTNASYRSKIRDQQGR